MKPRSMLSVVTLAGALAGTTPAVAGPLGIVSGGVGAIGALGGNLSGVGGHPAAGIGGMLGAAGQFQGVINPPGTFVDVAPLHRATGIVHTVRGRAVGRVESAGEAALQQSGAALGRLEGAAGASAGASGEASGSAQAASPSASAGAEFDGAAQARVRR